MFKDRNKELQRLEQALLEDETKVIPVQEILAEDEELLTDEVLDELLDDVAPGKNSVPYQNFSNDYGHIYNSDITDDDLDEYCEEVLEEPAPSYTGLILLACGLALGILGLIIVLLLRSGGVL